MATESGMRRVLEGRRQVCRPCPRCGSMVGLWLRLATAAEFQASHSTTDVTASLSPPAERESAMRRGAEAAERMMVAPWISCVRCGYNGLYQFGGGMPGDSMYLVGDEGPAEALRRIAESRQDHG